MKLAATYGDTWVTTGDPSADELGLPSDQGAAVVRAQMDQLDDACTRIGRDPATLPRLVLSGLRLDSGLVSEGAFEETLGRYGAIGVTDFVVHWPRPSEPFAGDTADFERIVTRFASA